MPRVISSKYLPNRAALSEDPRATRTIKRSDCDARYLPYLRTLGASSLRVRLNASGCCRISSSIKDIAFPYRFIAQQAITEPCLIVPAFSPPDPRLRGEFPEFRCFHV